MPSDKDLPSAGKLIKSTVLAVLIAAVLLITVVLPAEYGIDPIGVGEMLGLAKMGEIKVSLAEEAAADRSVAEEIKPASAEQETEVGPSFTGPERTVNSSQDKLTITLEPDEGKEIKLTMTKGATVDYVWFTNGGKANFDAHADSKLLEIKYHNYEKGKLQKSEGTLEAAFDGNHGWFWRNRTSKTMTVTLEVSGDYTAVVQY
jgi:hypothetical protein